MESFRIEQGGHRSPRMKAATIFVILELYYAWADISSTVTTWVMVMARNFSQHPLTLCLQVFPVVGLLFQAPFESNKNFPHFSH